MIHWDQGSPFTGMDWASFLKQHNMEHSTLSPIALAKGDEQAWQLP